MFVSPPLPERSSAAASARLCLCSTVNVSRTSRGEKDAGDGNDVKSSGDVWGIGKKKSLLLFFGGFFPSRKDVDD